MKIVMLGIDLGKNLCSLAGLDRTGAVVFRRRMKRESILPFTAQLESCTVAMEACCGAHHLGQQFIAQGHVVRLMSPAYVRPYVKAQKNDERDAEAIAEAATRPTMRYVEIKSEAQLEVQSLHRVRGRLVAERTALINQMRALMLERGITVPQGRCKLERHLPEILSNERNGLAPRLRRLIEDMREEWRSIDRRIKGLNDELTQRARNEEAAKRLTTIPRIGVLTATAKRLTTIPGIGVLTATALIAAVGNARTFTRGRDLAAWLGLVPRQATTGGKPRLLRISKRGNGYLRMLLIHGARTALPGLAKKNTPLGRWLRALLSRAHRNVVIVALANKLARIAWAVLARDRQYVTV
jgi:transposase